VRQQVVEPYDDIDIRTRSFLTNQNYNVTSDIGSSAVTPDTKMTFVFITLGRIRTEYICSSTYFRPRTLTNDSPLFSGLYLPPQ